MDALHDVARPHGLLVLEDAAQAARRDATAAGGSDRSARPPRFSFYPSKNLGALGDGGAICTDDALLAARLRRLRNLGQRAKGEHVELGYNERLDGLQAALLSVKLRHLDAVDRARGAACAAQYRERLAPTVTRARGTSREPVRLPRVCQSGSPAATRSPTLLRSNGIETGIHYRTRSTSTRPGPSGRCDTATSAGRRGVGCRGAVAADASRPGAARDRARRRRALTRRRSSMRGLTMNTAAPDLHNGSSEARATSRSGVAVIGLGYWGPNLLRVLSDKPDVEVRWVCDLDDDRLQKFGRRYPGASTRRATSTRCWPTPTSTRC